MRTSAAIQVVVALSILIDATLYFAILPLLPLYARHFHLTTFEAGLIMAAYPLAVLATSMPSGLLTSRLGARRLTIAADLAFALATVVFALAPSGWVLAVARAVQGVASGIAWSSGLAWMTAVVPRERRGRAVGRAMALLSAGAISGPVIGAVAAHTGSIPPFFAVAALTLCLAFGAIVCPAGPAITAESGPIDVARKALASPVVAAAAVLAALDGVAASTVELLVPLHLGRLGYSATAIGTCLVVAAVLAAVAGWPVGRAIDGVGAPRVGVAGACALTSLTALFILPLSAAWLFIFLALTSPLSLVVLTVLVPLSADGADAAGLGHGTVNGLTGTSWSLGVMGGAAASGAIAQAAGDALAFAAAAAALAALTCICLTLIRSTRGKERIAPVSGRAV